MGKSIARIVRYMLFRTVMLFITVVIGVYLTVIIVNMGGYLDKVKKAEIRIKVAMAIYNNPAYQGLPSSELQKLVDEQAELEYRRQGLDRPFIVRSFDYLLTALSLSLGRSENLTSDSGSRQVRRILLERLPATLILFGTADLIYFFLAIFVALYLSRHYGSFLDKLVIALAPTSAAPSWFYGIFLILIFAAVLRVLPWGGLVDAPPPKTMLGYSLSLAKHLVLPVTAWLLGGIFSGIYSWRTFFLIYSNEDYVELAKAKGLSSRAIERRYILRPTLPTIITSFALMAIAMWMGAIITETVFNWPGIGRLLLQAINLADTPVVVGAIVIYAYLLALTVFLLDFIYAIVDPRVRVGPGAEGRR